MPLAPENWLVPLLIEMPKWGIDTPNEQASFLAQIAHESGELTRLQENLDYSAKRLVQVWPKRFFLPTPQRPQDGAKRNARDYEHNPRKLAEYVYGGRLGNGPEGSGDAWKYRGRSPVHLTGRKNYQRAERAIGLGIVAEPYLLLVPTVGVVVSCWWWKAGGFDAIDDDGDIVAETLWLNGGETGLKERQAYFDKLLEVQRA